MRLSFYDDDDDDDKFCVLFFGHHRCVEQNLVETKFCDTDNFGCRVAACRKQYRKKEECRNKNKKRLNKSVCKHK